MLSRLSDSLDKKGSRSKVGIRYQWETEYLEDKGVQITFHRLTWTPFSTSNARTQKRLSFRQDSPPPPDSHTAGQNKGNRGEVWEHCCRGGNGDKSGGDGGDMGQTRKEEVISGDS